MAVDVIMPRLGLTMETGTIVAWLKEDGGPVVEGEPLLEVETDKATVEINAPATGVLRRGAIPVGEPVPVGTVLAQVVADGNGKIEAPAAAAPQVVAEDGTVTKLRATPAARRAAREMGVDLAALTGSGPEGRIKEVDVLTFRPAAARPPVVSPLAKKAAAELGVDVSRVRGSGPGGRIHRADVYRVAASPASGMVPAVHAAPAAQPPFGPPSRRVPLSNVRATTAKRMAQSFQTAPHSALSLEVEMTEAIRMRQRLVDPLAKNTGQRLTFTAIVVRCVAEVLRQHPEVNASYGDGGVERYEEVNVGVAMATDHGLVVPVIRNADRKSLAEIAATLAELETRAAALKFRPEEMSGGTFTISNLGMFGIAEFTAIINPPEAAILAVGMIEHRAVVRDGAVVARPMMTLTLSIDHRALDGADAAKFLRDVKETLENPYLLV